MHVDAACFTPAVPIPPGSTQVSWAPAVAQQDGWDGCAHADNLLRDVASAALAANAGGSVPAALMLSTRNTVRAFLSGACLVFEHMAEMVAAAQSEVLLQTFSWQDPSTAADLLRAALCELQDNQRARAALRPVQPVAVRIMVRRSPVQWLQAPQMPALEALVCQLDPNLVQLQVMEHPERLIGAMHSKSLVVDGSMAMLSGANIQRLFDRHVGWYDSGVLLTGDVAQGLRADALHLWSRCRQRCSNAELAPPDPALAPPAADPACDLEAGTPMLVLSRRGQGNPWRLNVDTPKDQAVLAALQLAARRICLISPNLNFPPVLNSLEQALRRGVRVDLVLSHGFNDDTERLFLGQGGINTWVVARLRHRLRDDPAALARLQLRWFSRDGSGAVQGKTVGTNHAKGMCVDDCLVLMGSFNFDTQSSHSREIGVCIGCAVAARDWLDEIFMPAFLRGEVG